MKATIQYEKGNEVTIRTADGGIASCHFSGEYMATYYYHKRTHKREPNYEELGDCKMSFKAWKTKVYLDAEIIMDVLHWLTTPKTKFEITEHYLFPTPAMGVKDCTTCKIEKTRDEFFKDPRNKNGMTSECKLCRNKRSRGHTKKNKKLKQ